MNNRIKAVRKHYRLTQSEFGDRLGAKQTTVANWENSSRNPSSTVVSLICREFSVDEHWLRTGEGTMIREQDRENALMEWVGTVLADEPESFRRRYLTLLMNFTPEDWKRAEQFALSLIPNPPPLRKLPDEQSPNQQSPEE